jgi:iron(II)-dependent oxidoreductase
MRLKWLWGKFFVSLCLVFLAGCGQGKTFQPEFPTLTETPTSTPPPTLSLTLISTETPFPSDLPVLTETPIRYSYHLTPAMSAEDCKALDLPEAACTGVSANQDWTPVIREFGGVEMVLVPAGCFMMGYEFSFDEEKPAHEVCLDQPYWIDRIEVTVSQFADFLNDVSAAEDDYYQWIDLSRSDLHPIWNPNIQLKYEKGIWRPGYKQDANPQEYVTWLGGNDICAWRGGMLPTEAEWAYAARGPDNLVFPWGNAYSEYYVVRGRAYPHAGSKPQGASWVGALDMAGSEFEWTRSLYKPYPYDQEDGRENSFGTGPDNKMVFRGSALYHDIGVDNVSSTARFEATLDVAFWYHGARCVRPVD